MAKSHQSYFVESALSEFQITDESTLPNAFERSYHFSHLRKQHMRKINRAWRKGDREKFFSLFDLILKQEEERNER